MQIPLSLNIKCIAKKLLVKIDDAWNEFVTSKSIKTLRFARKLIFFSQTISVSFELKKQHYAISFRFMVRDDGGFLCIVINSVRSFFVFTRFLFKRALRHTKISLSC